ncbi:nitroreductase family protein [Paenibacillus kribbensis]|uniref:nitroreductase family protein n=1 Tax=Paenibacillus TaxID=44249 RepID=UPI00024F06EA|nr:MULTISPECIES: nitroreductase family protein [Paenibacillus]EHS55529.1 nitroreductase [Paenibacillus sp. Aloe-11]MEC0236090.1 nitroreductase family protein [Paenibacillus kribbensis]
MSTTGQSSALFADVIHERRSVRHYDKSVRLSHEEIKDLLKEATLAPSSSNSQSWRFLVIETEELKAKLQPIAYNQSQVTEAAAVIAVLGDTEGYKRLDEVFGESVKRGYMEEDTAKAFVERSINAYTSMPEESLHKVIHIDGGIVSQQLMLVARAHGYDTVPMGGYDAAEFKQAFGISERYIPIMLIALGKAAQPGHQTTRLPIDDITFFNEMPAN